LDLKIESLNRYIQVLTDPLSSRLTMAQQITINLKWGDHPLVTHTFPNLHPTEPLSIAVGVPPEPASVPRETPSIPQPLLNPRIDRVMGISDPAETKESKEPKESQREVFRIETNIDGGKNFIVTQVEEALALKESLAERYPDAQIRLRQVSADQAVPADTARVRIAQPDSVAGMLQAVDDVEDAPWRRLILTHPNHGQVKSSTPQFYEAYMQAGNGFAQAFEVILAGTPAVNADVATAVKKAQTLFATRVLRFVHGLTDPEFKHVFDAVGALEAGYESLPLFLELLRSPERTQISSIAGIFDMNGCTCTLCEDH
jgi:hypothetical protein